MFGFFKKYNAHLCSAVSGRILDSGKPLVGVKIERELYYIDNKRREDSTLTDENGLFNLPAVNVRSQAPGWLFCEQLTKQVIYTKYNNNFFKLWAATAWGIKPIPAYERKLSELNADLSDPLVAFTFIDDTIPNRPHSASSICRWESDFKILHTIEKQL
ncbi:DUF6795 domain-containing protein [Colwellia sp. E150_009]